MIYQELIGVVTALQRSNVTRRMNLTDPIIPGRSIGGISIGEAIKDLLDQYRPVKITTRPLWDLFEYEGIMVWVNPDEGIIYQIAATAPYTGKAGNGLRIGMTLSELERTIGQVEIGEHDELLISGCAGVGLELSQDIDNPLVTNIVVFQPNG